MPGKGHVLLYLSIVGAFVGLSIRFRPHIYQRRAFRKLGECSTDQPNCVSGQLIEGGSVLRECSIHDGVALLTGNLINATDSIVFSMTECCKSCFSAEECNAWMFCPVAGGCSFPSNVKEDNETKTALSSPMPYGGCRLLGTKVTPNLNETNSLIARGTQFITGVPVKIFLPSIEGYETYPGFDLGSKYDYQCGYSPDEPRCELIGSVSEISGICNADPRCRGFVFIPESSGMTTQDTGILKGGNGQGLLDSSELESNQTTNSYLLTSEGAGLNTSSSNNNDTILWITLPTIAGVALIIMVGAAVFFAIMTKKQEALLKQNQTSRSNGVNGAHQDGANESILVDVPRSDRATGSIRMETPLSTADSGSHRDDILSNGGKHQSSANSLVVVGASLS